MTKAATAPAADKPGEETAVTVASTGIVPFDPIAAALAALRQRLDKVVYDVTTPAGMAIARKDRAEIRTLRGKLETARVEVKRDALEYGRKVDATAKDIREALEALEANPDAQITAWEESKERERAAKEQAERERVDGIRAKIADIARKPVLALGATTETLRRLVGELDAVQIEVPVFLEFAREAEGTRATALLALKDALAKSEKADADAAALKEAQAALAKQQAEERARDDERRALAAKQDAADRAAREAEEEQRRLARKNEDDAANAARAEADRVAKEARDKADAEAKTVRDAENARLAEEKRQAEERQAALDRQDQERTSREHAEIDASMGVASKDPELRPFIDALKQLWNAPAGPETTRATLKLCKMYKEALHPKAKAA